MSRTVPESWVVTTLGEAFSWGSGGTPLKSRPEFYDGDIPWAIIGDLNDGPICRTSAAISEEGLRNSAAKWLQPGSVLLAMYGSIGKLGINTIPLTTNQAIAFTQPEPIDPKYLFYFLLSARSELIASGKGGTQSNISQTVIKQFPFIVAPLAEQHRIVEAIESYFTRLDDAVATLERVQRNLKRYRASVLKAAVEGRLVPTEAELARAEGRDYEPADVLLQRILAERRTRTKTEPEPIDVSTLRSLPQGWVWTSVDAVGDVLLGRQRAPQYLTGRYPKPYLRVANIKDDRIDLSDLEEMDFDPVHFEKYKLLPGDILVSEGQSPELLGQSAIYRGGIDEICFQKTLHRFRSVNPGPSSDFAQLVFRSHVKSGIFKALGSITTNIAHLTLIKFKGAPFPLPPAREQQRITAEAHRILSEIDSVEKQIRSQLTRAARLRQSVLKWAFEARLVDQDPSDEPASVLLERIQAERNAAAMQKKTERRRSPKTSKRRSSPKSEF